MKTLIVDRIENGVAVCENHSGEMQYIPLKQLPANVKEGTVIKTNDSGFFIDTDEEKKRRNKNIELQKKVFGDE